MSTHSPESPTSTAIVWLRRDLRLADHEALSLALEHHDHVYLVYFHAPHEEAPWHPGEASLWWLQRSLADLQSQIEDAGGHINILSSADSEKPISSLAILQQLAEQYNIDTIYWQRLYNPYLVERDKHIKSSLKAEGIDVHSVAGYLFFEPWEIHNQQSEAYKVYTPFSKQVLKHLPSLAPPKASPDNLALARCQRIDDEVLPASLELHTSVDHLPWSNHVPASEPWFTKLDAVWQPGSRQIESRLQHFLNQSLNTYEESRNFPANDGTSKLSAALYFGEISPKQVWAIVQSHQAQHPEDDLGTEKYIKELIWRDFAHHTLFHFPDYDQKPKQTKFADMQWDNDPALQKRWQQGQTGIPIIDAGMRELWQTGYMHNRVRMLVASLLTKNLNQHWLVGAKWFWDTLVDADLANNTQGWQWTAGCGVDAAPYFRIFNPATQGKKFDPNAEYISQYVPELTKLPIKYRFAPWEVATKNLATYDFELDRDYPSPIVDLKSSRANALERFKSLA